MAGHTRHRASTLLKQQNKKHKSGRRTKAGLRRLAGAGRTGGLTRPAASKKGLAAASKATRLNQARQLQRSARDLVVKQRREHIAAPSKMVALVPLSERVDAEAVARALAGIEGAMEDEAGKAVRMAACRNEFKYVTAGHGDIVETLDIVSVADVVVLCMAYPSETEDDTDEGMSVASARTGMSTSSMKYQSLSDACSDEAMRVMYAVKGLGSPPLVGVLVGPERPSDNVANKVLRQRRRLDVAAERMARRFFGCEFGDKVPWHRMDCGVEATDARRLVEAVLTKRKGEPAWRAARSMVLCEEADILDGCLRVAGWVRVKPFSALRLVHVPQLGAAAVSKLEVRTSATDVAAFATHIPDPEDLEPLEMRAEANHLGGEQTRPEAEEMTLEPPAAKTQALTSDYQAVWDLSDDEDNDDSNELYQGDNDLNVRENLVVEKRQRLAEEMEFPDEVETPLDVPARQRFAKYRPLINLRDAQWDPYESLPRDYARAHALPNYEASRKAAIQLQDLHMSAPVGSYVSISLRLSNVKPQAVETAINQIRAANGTMPIYSLLRHENRLSVVHFNVRLVVHENDDENEPLASKEAVIARVGFRSWLGRPLFSQPLAGQKHKFERYLRPGEHCVASLYGPITFSPVPVFFFRRNKLVAVGTAIDADPNRVVLKRVILTGLPLHTHKRKAVVKHMFNNSDDVRFYKPAQLTTKHGLTANITEPLGTHGLFKIALSRPMRQSDTIVLSLYKRIYPKFVRPEGLGDQDLHDDTDISAYFRTT